MKYKKLLIFITSLIFVTALIFSSVFLFRIAEINLTVNSLRGSNENVNGVVSTYMKSYEGKSIVLSSKKKIKLELEGLSKYVKVISVEKVFPNKLNVEVEERLETYALEYQNAYYIFDEDLKLLDKKQENLNNINYMPNIELILNLSDYNEKSFLNEKSLNFYDSETQNCFEIIKQKVLDRRENIKSITVNVRTDGKINKYLVLTMTEGLEIQIDKSNERLEDKLNKLFEYYDQSENKGDTVKRYVTLKDNGEIVVI